MNTNSHTNTRNIAAIEVKQQRSLCQMPHCGKKAQKKGLCRAHGGYSKCSVANCTKAMVSGGQCIGVRDDATERTAGIVLMYGDVAWGRQALSSLGVCEIGRIGISALHCTWRWQAM